MFIQMYKFFLNLLLIIKLKFIVWKKKLGKNLILIKISWLNKILIANEIKIEKIIKWKRWNFENLRIWWFVI